MASPPQQIIGHALRERVTLACEHCREPHRWPSADVCRSTPRHRQLPAPPTVFFCSTHCAEMFKAVGVLMRCQRAGCDVRFGSKQAAANGGGPFYCGPECADMDAPRRAGLEREMARRWRAQPARLLRIA